MILDRLILGHLILGGRLRSGSNVARRAHVNTVNLSLALLIAGSSCGSPQSPRAQREAEASGPPRTGNLGNPSAAAESTAPSADPTGAQCSARQNGTHGPQLELSVTGFLPALLDLPLPLEALQQEPLLLAAHGAGDSAEAQCEMWRQIIGPCAAILCIRGTAIGPGSSNGYFFRNHLELEKEVFAAMQALGAAHGDHIRTRDVIYVAYSQGATMGALMLPQHAATFSRLVLVEGGNEWSRSMATSFAENGGQRVLLVCGTGNCTKSARRSQALLEAAGVWAQLLDVPGGGHAYWGTVAGAVAKNWPQISRGDTAFD